MVVYDHFVSPEAPIGLIPDFLRGRNGYQITGAYCAMIYCCDPRALPNLRGKAG